MTHAQLERLRAIAYLIAFVWAPALGRRDALHAANNAMQQLAVPSPKPFGLAVMGVLEHQRRAFGTPCDQRTTLLLAQQAIRVWTAQGGPDLLAAIHRSHLRQRVASLVRDHGAEAAS